jgi:hypothetical protein
MDPNNNNNYVIGNNNSDDGIYGFHDMGNVPGPDGALPFNGTRFASRLLNGSIYEDGSHPEHADMFAFAYTNMKAISRNFVIFQSYVEGSTEYMDFDNDWLEASNNYVATLPVHDKYILRTYTRNGDEVVNSVLRENAITLKSGSLLQKMFLEARCPFAISLFREYDSIDPADFLDDGKRLSAAGQDKLYFLYMQHMSTNEILKSYVLKYAQELRRIIRAAPTVPRELLTFRAVKEDYLVDTNDIVTIKGFTSTSYSPESVSYFAAGHSYKNMYEFVLAPGSHAISMYSISEFANEYEILLDFDCCVYPMPKQEKFMLHDLYQSDSYDKKHHPTSYYYTRNIFLTSQPVAAAEAAEAAAEAAEAVMGGRAPTKAKSMKYSKKAKSAKVSPTRKTRIRTPDKSLPFWKVRDVSIPRITKETVSKEVKDVLLESVNKYIQLTQPVQTRKKLTRRQFTHRSHRVRSRKRIR